jgi:hypothetical protein
MKTTKKNQPVIERQSEKKMPSKEEPKRELKRDASTEDKETKEPEEERTNARSDTKKRQEEMQNAGKDMEKSVELDEDIRNDIFKTEVNPHIQKRGPIERGEKTPEENHGLDLNNDNRIVNDQEDALDEDKYKDV